MKRYFTESPEIKARTRSRWMDTDRDCIAEINADRGSLRRNLNTDIDICMRTSPVAYIVDKVILIQR